MIALTKTLALEHAPASAAMWWRRGRSDTAFLRGGTGRSDEDGACTIDIAAYGAMMPLKRIAVPEDVVGPILFLSAREPLHDGPDALGERRRLHALGHHPAKWKPIGGKVDC